MPQPELEGDIRFDISMALTTGRFIFGFVSHCNWCHMATIETGTCLEALSLQCNETWIPVAMISLVSRPRKQKSIN